MMGIEITNQQKVKKVNLKQLDKYLKKIFVCLNIPSKKLSILLCDNTFIKKLNKKYFKKLCATDVIAFPLADRFQPDYLGEVVISIEEAVKAAKRLNCKWQDEVKLYLIHGVLHLIGYDDRTKVKKVSMDKEQTRILKNISK